MTSRIYKRVILYCKHIHDLEKWTQFYCYIFSNKIIVDEV